MSEAHRGSVVAARHMIITQRLRERRDDLGLTQKQIVTRLAKCGLQTTNRALSSLEHGAGLDVAKLPELAIALDCTVTYLIGLTEDPHSWVPDPVAPTGAMPRTAPAAPAAPAVPPAPSAAPPAPPAGGVVVPRPRAGRSPAGRPATTTPGLRTPAAGESLILGAYVPDRPIGNRRPGSAR